MGSYIRTLEGDLLIPAEKQGAALASLQQQLMQLELDYLGGEEELVKQNPFYRIESLEQALTELGFDCEEEDGVLRVYNFDGKQREGFDYIGRALAGYVEAGCYLLWIGEDTEQWRWYYTGKNFHVQTPTITWPQVEDDKNEGDQDNG